MAPIIHCVRHAQGFHNLGTEFHTLPDPRLTPLGEEQCTALRQTYFSDQSNISLITASPLCRTLHTAYLTFQPALTSATANGVSKCAPQILALPDAQETSDYPCDTGSDPSILRGIVSEHNWPVDLTLVYEGWNVKTMRNRYSPASSAIKARARDTRVLLRQKIRDLVARGDADAQVVLVSHGGYLHYFTDDWEDAATGMGTGWRNCETRSYVFEEDFGSDGDQDARLTETRSSRERRGKMYPMPGREAQAELFERGMQGWEDQGLQRPDQLGDLVYLNNTVAGDVKMDVDAEGRPMEGLGLERQRSQVEVMG